MRHNFPMPFGSRSAVVHRDPRDAANAMYSSDRRLQHFEAVGNNKFIFKTSSVRINDIFLLSQAGTPCQFEFEEADGCVLFVPCSGSGIFEFDRKQNDLSARLNAIMYPNKRRSFKLYTDVSAVILLINQAKISHIIANKYNLEIENTEFYQLKNIDLSSINERLNSFFAICNLIESQFENQDALAVLGVDDLINRWVAWCLSPLGDEPAPRIEMTRIDVVCDLVRASVDKPLTLTQMEDVSGLSARSLQYIFKLRFGCSPMQWQRRERLLGAKARILAIRPGESITTIAHSMGYSSSSAFAALYKLQFGETPSDTILRNR